MSIEEQKLLAETLRTYFVEHLPPSLRPVQGGMFSLDALQDEQKSMSMQITGGRTIRRYINGARVEEMHFTIFYRDTNVNDNEAKSAMLGTLNGIGTWMDNADKPYLGEGFIIQELEQLQMANVIEQTPTQITYQAGFVLRYETRN